MDERANPNPNANRSDQRRKISHPLLPGPKAPFGTKQVSETNGATNCEQRDQERKKTWKQRVHND